MTGPVFLERPWALWLGLGLAALAVLAARRAGGSASGPRLRAALVLRVLGLLLASVAAAGPHRDGAGGRSLQLLVAAAPDAGRDRPAPGPGEEEVLREAPTLARALPPALGARDPRAAARRLALRAPGAPDPAAAEAGLRRAAAAGIPVLVAPRRAPPPSSPAAPAPEPPLLEGLALPPGLAAGVPFAPRPLLRGGAGGGTGGAAEGISVD
ncbi:MAG: hypothetical protein L6R43_19865, partial [Planctomycetes bacterium]|nr:hypothetical protein [Planctomycetota bacterium]